MNDLPKLRESPCPTCDFTPWTVRNARIYCARCKRWYQASPSERTT